MGIIPRSHSEKTWRYKLALLHRKMRLPLFFPALGMAQCNIVESRAVINMERGTIGIFAGMVMLFLALVIVLVTGPAPNSQLFAVIIAPVISETERKELFEDKVLSLVEINEITCRRARELNIGSQSTCWLSDYWPLPKSIPWPLNS